MPEKSFFFLDIEIRYFCEEMQDFEPDIKK